MFTKAHGRPALGLSERLLGRKGGLRAGGGIKMGGNGRQRQGWKGGRGLDVR